ncbi:hypothetical protein MPQ_0594 [Methylovorus sp. MP688]|nr:hypothetical protein MPQ_0594 [Methylovorus sp. MP688]
MLAKIIGLVGSITANTLMHKPNPIDSANFHSEMLDMQPPFFFI